MACAIAPIAQRTSGQKTGYDLPRRRDPHDPVWQAWLGWSRDVLTDLIGHWNGVVASERPHGRFIPNIGNSSMLDFDLDEVESYCPILFVDHQGRNGVVPVWSAGRDGKRMRGAMGDRPIGLITSTSVEEKWRWKDSVQSPEEIRMWMTDGMAHGLRPWFTKFNAKVPDSRWVAPIAETFRLHAKLEKELGPLHPTAEIALLDPSTTLAQLAPRRPRRAPKVMSSASTTRWSRRGCRSTFIPTSTSATRRSIATS